MAVARVKLILLLFALPILAVAQVREPGAAGVVSAPPMPQPTSAPGAALSTTITSSPVELGPGDLLEITVFQSPELSEKVRVDSEGSISLPLLGQIKVGGKNSDKVQEEIRSRLQQGRFVKDPRVSVFVVEYAGQLAYITGEVNRPGAYPLLRSHRLQDLIAVAGGLTIRAGNTATITHQGDTAKPVEINLAEKNDALANPEISPGDSISIGQTGIVYVLGEVARPGGFLIERLSSISVMQAISLAEGTTATASLSKAHLIRTTAGTRQEIALNLKHILKSQSPDVTLQAGDILYIPGSATRGLGRRTIDTIMATASGVAIYGYRY